MRGLLCVAHHYSLDTTGERKKDPWSVSLCDSYQQSQRSVSGFPASPPKDQKEEKE